MSDWAAEVELSEKAISESIRKITDQLKSNEDVSAVVTEISETYNIPEDIERVIKNWLFDKDEQGRIAEAHLYRTRKTDL